MYNFIDHLLIYYHLKKIKSQVVIFYCKKEDRRRFLNIYKMFTIINKERI